MLAMVGFLISGHGIKGQALQMVAMVGFFILGHEIKAKQYKWWQCRDSLFGKVSKPSTTNGGNSGILYVRS